jgi:ABC-type branched-subunit amino acid transport system substrate-binding protein
LPARRPWRPSAFLCCLARRADVIRIGHLTPRTGFLGPLGEFAVQAADMAVAEINAAGGVSRPQDRAAEGGFGQPQTASTKAERMIERDKVACIIGEISSASGLTISQVAERTRTLFINTGCNSDELRGKGCKKYMFHIESQNSMYVKTCGRSLMAQGLVKGKKWFSLTADYAFGHDLLRVAKRFMSANGGDFAADKLVPTDATDFSPAAAGDPQCQARPGDFQPGRQPDHQLPQAVLGIRAAFPRRRIRLRHRGGVGRGARQFSRAPGRWCGTT